ncbi:DNA-3-methyladenine glycosylase I [Methylopila capsulata]|uniref:DNA-3-methyladenine glycosylase I n=1 Tax=Methylopila capsulata TaxID=61654 RepID=A0A9W6IVP6_9HYPH|nr:DNA-3-methyladenine glycosylase I [Methylopila capsulata]MBM7852273.1 DNA-3-methyladenine glycosylase I [Methylopila capsulata]GLK56482.1 DNA-3-methyladenine glycosylase I [Methylopila capsulata]
MSEAAPRHADGKCRCAWCGTDPLYVAYHDTDWGRPERDSRALYEKLVLDGFQAGLAWITILRKREAFRAAFQGFEPEVVARFGEVDVTRLLGDAGIVRSRAKIEGAVKSARAVLAMRERGEDFSEYLWGFVDGAPIVNPWRERGEVPVSTPLSEALSKDLKRRGFTFCGPVIVYAFMQAVGMIDDHVADCWRKGAHEA